ncbi:hypothetical protein FEM48_Zijuj12G0111700 [Ziziphus jujuba var. spinosa]|uniref:Uncharacterized protein n=1 Tax=Ziziphus jujuba var. spinosa TaxID=714518 RepID=A0A978UCZ1_ZIZJJ|nr:hypothetical protein FEM48_Zijuj12G0111700 [Ziziphus jujuba var. spinosa]
MNFKFRNGDWVGNIYQKFEAMCQEIDDINPVQYVENQVHNVGENVMKFCSDVIQDLLPPPSDSVKTEAKAVPPEGNAAINAHVDSVLATKKVSSDIVTKLSHMEAHVIDPIVNQVDDVSGEHRIVDQLNTPNSVDAGKESDSVLSNGKIADVLTDEKSELGNEVKAIEECAYGLLEKTSPIEIEPVEVSPVNEFSDNNITNKHVILSEVAPETSAYVSESESPRFYDIADHTECDIGSSSAKSEMAFTVVTAAEGDNIDSSSSQPEMAFSVVQIAEREQESNNSSVLKDSINSLSGNSSEILPSKEVFCHNHVDRASCVSDSPRKVLSPIPASIFSTEHKAVEAQPVSSSCAVSLKSVGEANCRNSENFSLIESSGQKDTKSCEIPPFEACIPSIEIDDYDSMYSSMETIDLCDKVKLEESCVFVDDSALYTISCRVQKLRSYKKRIQDIFASKKRLAKEYEQLPIWYGDCDIDSSSRTPFDKQNLQTHHECDSEWELL